MTKNPTRNQILIKSKRPDFTIAQLTDRFAVSRSTLRRGLADGRFPNATKDHSGRWLVPVDDVLQAGFTPRKTWLNEGGHDPTHEPGSPTQTISDANEHAGFMNPANLENELAHERAQVDKLKALLEAERSHVESLRMALRMIEPATPNSPKEHPKTIEPSPEQAVPEPHPTARKPPILTHSRLLAAKSFSRKCE